MTTSLPPAGNPEASARPSSQHADAQPSGGRGALFVGLFLVLLSIGLYLPTLDHHLVYDDLFLISPQLNRSMVPVRDDLGAALDLFTQEYWEGVNPVNTPEYKPHGQALYRPLTLFCWAVIQNLTAPEGRFEATTQGQPYHLLSILVNALVVWLFFMVVLRLFERTRLAFVAALIYAVHPLHSEAVAYVAGLSDQLAAATVLVGMLCFLRISRHERSLAVGSLVALLVALFTGLMAKESAVLTIAAVALTDLVLSLRGRAMSAGRRLLVYGGMLGVLAVQLLIRFQVIGYLAPKAETIGRLDNPMVVLADDAVLRAANAFKLVAKYVWLVLWPKDLSIDYSFNAIPLSDSWASPEPLAGTILVLAMLVVGLANLKRRPALGWGLLFFLGTTLFISNLFVPIGTIFADRLMYLPTLGAALVLAVVVDPLLGDREKRANNPLGLLLLVLAVGALGWRTDKRNADFFSSRDLFEAARKVVPESARVHYQLGSLYATEGRFNAAIERLQDSLDKDPSFIQSAIQLGEVYTADRNFDRAIGTFDQVLSLLAAAPSDPSQAQAVRALVLTKRATAKRASGDLDGALADLEQAMSHGGSETPVATLSWVTIQQNQGRFAETIPALRQALLEFPDNVELLLALSRSSVGAGDKAAYDESVKALKQTERGRPRALAMEAEVQFERAVAARDQAGRDAAIKTFAEVTELDPTMATPYYYQGRYLIEKQRSFGEGVAQYDKALERDPDHPGALLYKSLALIEMQRFEDALDTLRLLETVQPNESCYALMAEASFKLGDLEGQEAAYAKLTALGKAPVEMLLNRALSVSNTGDLDKAIEIVEQAMADPESANEPLVLRTLGVLLLDAGRCEEALATFALQTQAEMGIADPEFAGDAFLPINRARALACAGQPLQAMAELTAVEASLDAMPDDRSSGRLRLQVGVLHRKAELLLKKGSPLADPALGLELAQQALDLTSRQSANLFDVAIAGQLAVGNLDAALDLASEASGVPSFSKLTGYYAAIIAALEQAASGDRAGAAASLRAITVDPAYREGPGDLARIAAQLDD